MRKTFFGAVGAVAVILLLSLFSLRVFTVPSGSNIPILRVGDFMLTWRFGYGVSAASIPLPRGSFKGRLFASDPQLGDIAVFVLPKDGTTFFVKRVIGLPGDRVQMREGRLFINGTIVPREEAGTYLVQDEYGREQQVPKYIETLPNGVNHEIIEISGDKGYYDNTDEYVVPPGNYFTMGDNRDNSDDSRDLAAVGYIPADNFIAKAWRVLYSADKNDQRQFKIIQ